MTRSELEEHLGQWPTTVEATRTVMEKSNRQKRLNLYVLAAVTIVTMLGFATAVPRLLSENFAELWPWFKTDMILIIELSLSMLGFAWYLNHQQGQIEANRNRIEALNKEAVERSTRHTSRLYGLLGVSRMMGSDNDLQSVFDCITGICADTFDCNQASLMLHDKDTNELVVRSASGHSDIDSVLGRRQKMGQGIAGWAAEHREPLLLGRSCDLRRYPGLQLKSKTISAAMVVPVILRDELVGVINVSTLSADVDYDMEDLRALLVFAGNAGTAIRHTEQSHWMRQTIQRLQESGRPRKDASGDTEPVDSLRST